MNILIINNLSSGYGDGAIYDFIRHVAQDGDSICMRCTDGTTDMRDLLYDADSYDVVVASGGDGTVATVCHQLANTGIPVLPFPAGTANLLAQNISSPTETYALAKLLRTGKTLDFDLGIISSGGKDMGFLMMAGAGWDAAIMRGAGPHKRLLGPMAYFGAALANLTPQKSHLTLDIDGRIYECDGLGVLIINFSKIQFDLSITHENKPNDGFLDIAILKADNILELAPAFGAAFIDAMDDACPDRSDSVVLLQGKHVRVTADPPMEIQYDGEVTTLSTPFEAKIYEGAARIIVSEQGYESFHG